MAIIIRHDDFDFRLTTEEHIAVHEQFIKAGLIETAGLQFVRGDRIVDCRQDLIDYMNTTPNWDFQLHGWGHYKYNEMDFDSIVRDLAAGMFMCQKYFGKIPTVWYPPWNCYSENMQKAADLMGITIDNESYDISRFIRDRKDNTYLGHSFYFHAWQKHERDQLPEALDLVKSLLTTVA
jgi:hypothetical protein